MPDLAITSEGRLPSGGDPAQRLHRTALQLESVFVRELMKGLDDPVFDDEPLLGGGNAQHQFKDLLHNALAERAAGSFGVADAVASELGAKTAIHRDQHRTMP